MQARFISEYDALIRVSALLCIFSIIISWPSSGPRESRDFDPRESRESRGTGRKKIILWDIWDHMVNPGWIWCLMLFVIRDVLDNTRKYLIIVSGYYKITWSILNKSESKSRRIVTLQFATTWYSHKQKVFSYSVYKTIDNQEATKYSLLSSV